MNVYEKWGYLGAVIGNREEGFVEWVVVGLKRIANLELVLSFVSWIQK